MREGCDIDECDDNEKCEITALTMIYSVDEPEYPKQWTYDENGNPCCTAFIPAGDNIPEVDTHTLDMFS